MENYILEIKEIREIKNLTLEQLAQMAELTPERLRKIESNEVEPSVDEFFSIVHALKVCPQFLYEAKPPLE